MKRVVAKEGLAKYYSLNTGKKAEHQIIRRVIRKNSMKQCSEGSYRLVRKFVG